MHVSPELNYFGVIIIRTTHSSLFFLRGLILTPRPVTEFFHICTQNFFKDKLTSSEGCQPWRAILKITIESSTAMLKIHNLLQILGAMDYFWYVVLRCIVIFLREATDFPSFPWAYLISRKKWLYHQHHNMRTITYYCTLVNLMIKMNKCFRVPTEYIPLLL